MRLHMSSKRLFPQRAYGMAFAQGRLKRQGVPAVEDKTVNNANKLLTRDEMVAIISEFSAASAAGDLDKAMSYFTPDATYGMYDGTERHGREQIREAFKSQFENAFGRISFASEEMIVDEANQTAVVRWLCQHDMHQLFRHCKHPAPVALVVRAVYGATFTWHGLDVVHFEGPFMKAKLTYSKSHMPVGEGEHAHETHPTIGEILVSASG